MTARALVVAVPNPCGGLAPLPGTTADAGAMSKLLAGRGFDEVSLYAQGLTVDGFATQLLRLREATVADDLAVVYFAGHGYRIPDTNGDEGDGQDECLVCSDLLLTNDWFRDAFWPNTQEGSWWVTCADTCFSATVFRGLVQVREEEIPDDVARPMRTLPTPSGAARIWLAAAGEKEQALEVAPVDGAQYGWYSRQLFNLLSTDGDLTYRALWYRLQKRWAADKASKYSTLARPCMASSDAAEPLVDQRALAGVS